MLDTQRKRYLITAAVAVLLLLDATLVYFNLKMSSPKSSPQQLLAVQNRQLALVKADIKRARDIKENIPKVLKAFDQYEASLPVASKGYSIISQEMDAYAKENHLAVDDTKFHEKELSERHLTELTMECSVSGDYNGIVHFLNQLQRSQNSFIIDALDADSQNPGQAPAGTLRVSLHLRTYFRKG